MSWHQAVIREDDARAGGVSAALNSSETPSSVVDPLSLRLLIWPRTREGALRSDLLVVWATHAASEGDVDGGWRTTLVKNADVKTSGVSEALAAAELGTPSVDTASLRVERLPRVRSATSVVVDLLLIYKLTGV